MPKYDSDNVKLGNAETGEEIRPDSSGKDFREVYPSVVRAKIVFAE